MDERTLIAQLCRDLNQAHDELMMAQGLSRENAAACDWPEWTPQANSLRCAEALLGLPLSKTSLRRVRPACPHGSVEFCAECHSEPKS